MDPVTFVAVVIVVAGMTLVVALAVSMIAEKPALKQVSLELWCPEVAQLTRVDVSASVDRRLEVVSCERFPNGTVACDCACIPSRIAA